MIDDIDSSNSMIRSLAWQELKRWKTGPILELLTDDDYVVRTLAACALHLRDDKEIFEYAVELTSSTSSTNKEIGAFVLGQLGTPLAPFKDSTIPILERLIGDEHSDVRAIAADSLGRLCFDGMPNSVELLLLNAASDSSPYVRCCAAKSLGNSDSISIAEAKLEELLQDTDKDVREFAELGLSILLEEDW